MGITSLVLSLVAVIISIASALSSKRTADASETSALAAERSARASEQQAAAIAPQLETAQAAAEAAKRQVDVAVEAAEEAKRIAGLSEAQMQASLRPVIALERRMGPQIMEDFVTNSGKGLALKLSANYGMGIQPNGFYVPNVLSADGELKIQVDWNRAKGEGMTFSYESQDGRKFMTKISFDNNWRPLHDYVQIIT